MEMQRTDIKRGLVFVWLCLCAWLVPLFSGAQPRSSSQVTYKTTSHNFGKIQETDGPVSYTFEFTNTSSTPFLIEFISVSCGCTAPEHSPEPVLPGRSGSIKVTFDPAGRSNAFHAPIVVTSNNRQDQVSLTLTGEVIPRPKTIEDQFPLLLSDNGLRATSNNLAFGQLGHGQQKSQTLDIYNNGTAPVRLGHRFTAESRAPRSICRVTVTPEVLQPKERGQVTFTYDLSGSGVYGLQAAAFLLTLNGQTTSRPISAYVTAIDDFAKLTETERANAPKAIFSSQFHHFGTVGRNQSLTREFQIKNDGKSPLIIRKTTANSRQISYSLPKTELAPGETVTLKVTLRTPNRSERVSESLSIVVNDPARPVREIRLNANVE